MPCLTPYRGDTSQMLLFKIASCLEASGAAGAAVLSFNGRTGDVVLTLADVAAVADDIYVNESGDTMTGSLNMTAGQAYQYNSVNVIIALTPLSNYFFGRAGNLTMTGNNNTSVGSTSLDSNTTGSNNTAMGDAALTSNLSGSGNSAYGVSALETNTTGGNNSAFGRRALRFNTSGDASSAFGNQALQNNTTGTSNVAVGSQALGANTTGNGNSAIGLNALLLNVVGNNNTAFGDLSLRNNVGSDNLAVGRNSLFDVTTGIQNVGIGTNTGMGITTGSSNTILGSNVTGLSAALSNNIILSDGAGVIRLQIDSSGNTTLAGTVATAAGTAALPAYTFSADLNTGLYNIGADSVGLSTGGTLRTTTNTTDLLLETAFRLAFASGANTRAGNAVLVGGTVTVANTSVTANTIVLLTRKTSGGTIGFAVTYTVIDATSFTLTSDNVLDTSTYSYLLIENP